MFGILGGGNFPRGGFPRRVPTRRVPPTFGKTAGSPCDFPRGVADGPRKTLAPTVNAGKPKRRTNKNATAGGKNDAGRDQHYRKPTPNAKNETAAAKTTPGATETKKGNRYAYPVDRAPILDDWGPKPLPP